LSPTNDGWLIVSRHAMPDERTLRYYLAELIPPATEKQGTASVFGYRHPLQLLVVKKLKSENLPIRKSASKKIE
jgi:hypothetical protein